jgi:arsenite methyltransferase
MNNQDQVRIRVKQAYTQIAEHPDAAPLFPTGRALAEGVGYPPDLLDTLPSASVEAFCGLSNVSLFAKLPEGASILEVGCGAGLDTLIAARRTGGKGKVVAVDFSMAMLARARYSAQEAGIDNVEFICSDAEKLPVPEGSMDVAIVNGIFNLNPRRDQIFSELARVVKPGGAIYAAEIVLAGPLPKGERESADSWLS